MKTCITCRQGKPLEDFHRRASSRDGHAPVCKPCQDAYNRRWRAENRERVLAAHRVRAKRYVLRNPETRKASMRAYRKSHSDQVSAYNAQWAKDNPLRCAAKRHRHWARVKGLLSEHITVEQLEAKLAEYGGLCAYCQEHPFEEWDHIEPLSKGGANVLSNIVPSCVHCNHTKWTNSWPAPTPPVMVPSPS